MYRRTLQGIDSQIFLIFAGALVLGQLYLLYVAPTDPLFHAVVFVSALTGLTFLKFGLRKTATSDAIPWYDWVLVLLSLVPMVYVYNDYDAFVRRSSMPLTSDILVGVLMVLTLLEAGRRAIGLVLPVIGIVALVYALINYIVPGNTGTPLMSYHRVFGTLFMTEVGIYSEPAQVALRWIFLFLVFGQALLLCGGQELFLQVALKAAGKRKGGAAYVSIVASALFGTLSGSSMANVLTTGQFTIPLMKRAGYPPRLAGAIEATASTGGSLTPPIMAAGALIMAEFTGVPYATIILAALVPAILFYIGVGCYVYGATHRLDITPTEIESPALGWDTITRFWPVVLGMGWLIYSIVSFLPLERAVLQSTAILFVGGFVANRSGYSAEAFVIRLKSLTEGIIEVGLACAIAGILVGIILLTGVGIQVSSFIFRLGQDFLFLSLVLTMLVTIFLGMGVPGIAAYVITASVVAVPLANLGIPILAAHMFIFYFSLFAGLTPPVALSAFAAAGLAGSNPFRTGLQSMVLALPAYLLAFYFIYQPSLLMIGTPDQIIHSMIGGAIGVAAFAFGSSGALFNRLGVLSRIALIVGGIALIDGSWMSDVVGALLILPVVLRQYRRRSHMMMA
ncbi:MAG: TRAP transporter fused permease subunit [Loktanella sp.]|nr:TRAP transporter fused permease subunit [Loktanella sp.]